MTETTQNAASPSTGTGTVVWPTFRYRDAVAAIDFLERAFGFVQRARYPEGGTVVEHAELAFPGGGGIMLGSVREGSVLCALPPGVGSVYIVVDDPDALYERAKAAGAAITSELCDQDYGSREFSCRDPEGVHWSFGTYGGA